MSGTSHQPSSQKDVEIGIQDQEQQKSILQLDPKYNKLLQKYKTPQYIIQNHYQWRMFQQLPQYKQALKKFLSSISKQQLNQNSIALATAIFNSGKYEDIYFKINEKTGKVNIYASPKYTRLQIFMNNSDIQAGLTIPWIPRVLGTLGVYAKRNFNKKIWKNKVIYESPLDIKSKLFIGGEMKRLKPVSKQIYQNSHSFAIAHQQITSFYPFKNYRKWELEVSARNNQLYQLQTQLDTGSRNMLKRSDIWSISNTFNKYFQSIQSRMKLKNQVSFDISNSSYFYKLKGLFQKILFYNSDFQIISITRFGYIFGKNVLQNDMLNRAKQGWLGNRVPWYINSKIRFKILDYPLFQNYFIRPFQYVSAGISPANTEGKTFKQKLALQLDTGFGFYVKNINIAAQFSIFRARIQKNKQSFSPSLKFTFNY